MSGACWLLLVLLRLHWIFVNRYKAGPCCMEFIGFCGTACLFGHDFFSAVEK